MPQQGLVDGPTLPPQFCVSDLQILGVPEDDGGDQQVEARGAEELVLEATIADFAKAAEVDGVTTRKCSACDGVRPRRDDACPGRVHVTSNLSYTQSTFV